MIKLENITLIFNPNTALEAKALDNINLDIAAGDFITLIGSNGAGKSTLLKVLTGDLKVSSGRLSLDGRDLTNVPVEKRSVDFAYVNQDPRLGTCEAFSIEENLAFASYRGEARGLGRALTPALRAYFRELLALLGLGLEKRLGDKVSMLSGGQRQVLSLIMATLQPCKLLLLDEHTAALDPKSAALVLELTNRIIQQNQLTAMMITHHLSTALEMGNRTLLLREGRIENDFNAAERSRLKPTELLDYF